MTCMRQTISTTDKKIKKKCKYFISGHCKFQNDCKFMHPETSCNDISCRYKQCQKRNPKPCRYKDHCRRQSLCVFLHKPVDFDVLALEDEIKSLKLIIESLKANLEDVTKELETTKLTTLEAVGEK